MARFNLQSFIEFLFFPLKFFYNFSMKRRGKSNRRYCQHPFSALLRLAPVRVALIFFLAAGTVSATQIANDTFDNGSQDGWQVGYTWRNDGWLYIDKDDRAYKTYHFGNAYANATLTVTFKFWVSWGWDNGDKFKVFRNNTQIKRYENLSRDSYYTKTITTTADNNGNFTLKFKPDSNRNDEYAAIDYITIDASATTGAADLRISQVAAPTPDPVAVNQDVTFKIRANNDGPDAAQSNIKIKVSYNQDVTISSVSQTAGGSDFSCSPNSGNLNSGSFITCTKTNAMSKNAPNKDFSFVVKSSAAGTLTQTTTIESTTTSDSNTNNNSITSSVTVSGPPGGTDTVTVTKTANNTTPEVGDTVSFTVTATNKGYNKRIEIKDGLPKSSNDPDGWGTTYNAFENISFSNVPADVTCSNQSYANADYIECTTDSTYTHNQSFTVTVNAKVKTSGHICNTVHAYEYDDNWKGSNEVCLDATPSSCNGCDCSLDDDNINNSSPGITIPALDGATGDVTKCISGSSDNSQSSSIKTDYYTFTVATDGDLDITTLSPNNHDFHFEVLKNGTKIYNDTTAQSHNVPTISLTANDQIVVWFKETGNDRDEYQATFDFTATTNTTIVQDTSDICYEQFREEGINLPFVSFFNKTSIPIRNLNVNELSDVQVALGSSNLFSAFQGCGVDDGTGTCEDASGKSFMMFSAFNGGVSFNLENLSQNESITPYTESLFSFLNTNNYDVVTSYVKNGVTHQGLMKECPVSYCETNNLDEGFHVIDPDGGAADNSFEIFCHKDSNDIWYDLLALPIKNSSNNFVFNNKSTSSNYYDEAANPRAHFNALEIDGGHITYTGDLPNIPLVTARSDEPWSITTDGKSYKVLGSTFSNINLIGTPFTINWDKTGPLGGCDESKLRKALKQAVKYNTLVGDSHSRCKISDMNLSLLDNYRFLVYQNQEVLQHSCKEMATYIPNNVGVLNDSDIDGYFNILASEPAYPNQVPTSNGTRDNATDIGAKNRPITVYCKYQTDLHYVWTFLTALDAKVTLYKTDLVTHQDTCSQFGLYFYVPNNKDTFNRVRLYLKEQKTGDDGWENYTGTIDEKINALHSGNHYYLNEFKNVLIWPYGPFGVYLHSGNRSAPRAPMHNIKTMSNYNDSLGKKGWVSILGSQDLNKTDDWWISDIGAGLEITKIADGSGNDNSTYHPHGNHPRRSNPYDEPNGNYTYDSWDNFLYDEEGWVYHMDDWNANYPYYDYMCMSETNYDTASRYTLIPGFFNVIERARNGGGNFNDENLTTQIVAKNISLDLILYKIDSNTGLIDKTHLEQDQNRSVGVFVSEIEEGQVPRPIQFIGEFSDFSSNNGRIQIPNFTIPSAIKRAEIQFYYCQNATADWRDCWDYNNNAQAPTVTSISDGAKKVDSSDDFAVRPKAFHIVGPAGNNAVKAENVNFTYYAYDYNNNPSNAYDEPFVNLDFNTSLADTTKTSACPNTSLDIQAEKFTNGMETKATKLSNVGVWRVQLKEKDGLQFAAVDIDDNVSNPTNGIDITPADINITIIPSLFTITYPTNIDYGNGFTYISNDLDHGGIKFDVKVTAKNSDGDVTPNYSTGCYANSIDLDLFFTINNTPTPITTVNYKELISNVSGSKSVTDGNLSLTSLPATLFTTADKGSADLSLRVNFNRAINTPVNPFKVKVGKFITKDVSHAPTIAYNKNDNILSTPLEATMVYGRVHAPRQRFISNKKGEIQDDALIYYEAYCNGGGCHKLLLPNGINSITTDDPRWFVNKKHVPSTDGNVTSFTQKGPISTIKFSTPYQSGWITKLPIRYDGSRGYPYRVTIEQTPSSWLLFNKYNPTATKDEFEVGFISGNSNWAGESQTDTTTKNIGSHRTNRRLMW